MSTALMTGLLLATTSPALAEPVEQEVDTTAQEAVDSEWELLEAQRAELAAERAAVETLRTEVEALQASIEEKSKTQPNAERHGLGEPITVAAEERVDEVVAFGGDVVVSGHVVGDAVSFGGNVHVAEGGRVEGDAVSFGGSVTVDEGGRLLGNRVAMGGPNTGMEVLSALDQHNAAGSVPIAFDATHVLQQMYRRLVLLLSVAGAGVLVVGLFPTRVSAVAQDLEVRPLRAAVVGMLTSGFVVLFSALFAVITLGLGLPVSALMMGLLGLAWLLGFVGLCQAVGDRLPLERRPHGRWLAFLVGVVLVTFFGSLPWIGWFVVMASSIIGVGAAISTRFGAVHTVHT
ncbi:MAG: polymer-forming cytoskeletal protein [Myxococcales bacterium]|nr:polymer-forming cytoskeletal protein [Myxococcales bacterium]